MPGRAELAWHATTFPPNPKLGMTAPINAGNEQNPETRQDLGKTLDSLAKMDDRGKYRG